jgi:hyperosmotically inducible periplasmic protein
MNRKHEKSQRRIRLLLAGTAAALALPLAAGAYDYGDRDKQKDKSMKEQASAMMERAGDVASDTRQHLAIEAKLAQSDQLSAFSINTDVEDGVARLEGDVETEAQRELAGELAMSVEGIKRVENQLQVKGSEPGFMERLQASVSEAALTTRVKTRLLASDNTSGLAISVETEGDVVTLTGEVESDEERELAELIASNTSGVSDVRNRLRVNDGY